MNLREEFDAVFFHESGCQKLKRRFLLNSDLTKHDKKSSGRILESEFNKKRLSKIFFYMTKSGLTLNFISTVLLSLGKKKLRLKS